jgi:dTDP-4-dehydrorhamnose reductase
VSVAPAEGGIVMKILVTGASGLLGSNVCKMYSSQFHVCGTYYNHEVAIANCGLFRLDLTEGTGPLKDIHPDVVIHCAAEADVDACEANRGRARQSILGMTQNVLALARECASLLIHISTDSLFDGKQGNHGEEDPVDPINVYSELKAEAESYIKAHYDQFCIIRGRFYGWNIQDKQCFAEQVISRLREGREVTCYEANYSTQILVNNAADIIKEIINRRITGVFNVVESTKLSRYAFAQMIAQVFGLPAKLVKAAPFEENKYKAMRPQDTSLSNEKARSVLRTAILSPREGLEEMRRLEECGYRKALKDGA